MNEGILIVIFNKFKYSRVMNVNITKNVRFDFIIINLKENVNITLSEYNSHFVILNMNEMSGMDVE